MHRRQVSRPIDSLEGDDGGGGFALTTPGPDDPYRPPGAAARAVVAGVRIGYARAAFALALVSVAGAALAQAPALSETEKIAALIRAVAELRDAKFVRNGSEYDAVAAADHLKLKLDKAGRRVKTAADFIRLCGSTSSMTGRPYAIHYADGRTETSEAFLRRRLAELEAR